ncbi:hypothetical protein LTR95_014683 [Oleoguttula sp. CCFEE 5521]
MAYPTKTLPLSPMYQWRLPDVLIIDGPGLAYYVYKAMQTSAVPGSSISSSPEYQACGDRTVAFLDDMERAGMRVEAIYFDGVLPSHKLETRLSRTQRHVDQLRKALLSSMKDARLPDAPFLVPSAIEALLESKYASRVRVVPAEADDYCALHARSLDAKGVSRPTILTNDSDMFVLDCGKSTQIMLLASLTRKTTAAGFQYSGEAYCPREIARSAGLCDLKQAAYCMGLDRNLTFDAAVAKLRRLGGKKPDGYASFLEKFETSVVDMSHLSPAVVACLQRMDPRVAEVAHQALLPDTRGELLIINAFLPLLHEDATRFSVWKVGHDIRNLAYRIVVLQGSSNCSVHEHTRRGAGVGHSAYALTAHWTQEVSKVLAWLVTSMPQAPSGASVAQRWHYIGTVMALQFYNEYYTEPMTYARVLKVLMHGEPDDWLDAHIAAMVQAALYSFRMLQQLLNLHDAQRGVSGDSARLHDLSNDMPGIAGLFTCSDADTVSIWKAIAETLALSDETLESSGSEDTNDSDDDAEDVRPMGSNPFSMLSR